MLPVHSGRSSGSGANSPQNDVPCGVVIISRNFKPLSCPWKYTCLVKVKTSITLAQELLVRLDRVDKNRSAVLERAALAYLADLDRQARDRRDVSIIDRNAKRLNREAEDTLEYQRIP